MNNERERRNKAAIGRFIAKLLTFGMIGGCILGTIFWSWYAIPISIIGVFILSMLIGETYDPYSTNQ